jgi:excisionase family DNA binding protein
MNISLRNLLPLRKAAEFLGIKPNTLYDWVSRRQIAFVRLGRRIMFDPSDLETIVAKNRVEARKSCEKENHKIS